jgi:hypothetical protein
VAESDLLVRLHFAEFDPDHKAAGSRVFDVYIEGELVVDDLDVFAEVGANTALVRDLAARVEDGMLTVELRPETAARPMLSGLEIVLPGSADDPANLPESPPGAPGFMKGKKK